MKNLLRVVLSIALLVIMGVGQSDAAYFSVPASGDSRSYAGVAVGDFDGGGVNNDIAGAIANGGAIYVYLNGGADGWFPVPNGSDYRGWAGLGVGDFDGGGVNNDIAIAVANGGAIYVYLNGGADGYFSVPNGSDYRGWAGLGVGDLDGGGVNNDISIAVPNGGAIYIFYNGGAGGYASVPSGSTLYGWAGVGVTGYLEYSDLCGTFVVAGETGGTNNQLYAFLVLDADISALCEAVGADVDALVPLARTYKNHGQYVSQVAHATEDEIAKLTCDLTPEQIEEISSCVVSKRAKSDVGKP